MKYTMININDVEKNANVRGMVVLRKSLSAIKRIHGNMTPKIPKLKVFPNGLHGYNQQYIPTKKTVIILYIRSLFFFIPVSIINIFRIKHMIFNKIFAATLNASNNYTYNACYG
jgi:hypothetical protein